MKRGRLFLGCGVLLAALVAGVLYSLRDDAELLSDADLRLKPRHEILDSENVYSQVLELGRRLQESDLDVVAEAQRALEGEVWQTPPIDELQKGFPIQVLMGVTTELEYSANASLEAGDPVAARRAGLLILELGSQMSVNARTVIEYMIGMTTLDRGLQNLVQSLSGVGLSAEESRRLTGLLTERTPNRDHLRHALKGEYECTRTLIDRFADPELDGAPDFKRRPNRTRNQAVRSYREVLRRADLPYAEFRELPVVEPRVTKMDQIRSSLGLGLGGDVWVRLAMPSIQQIIDLTHKMRAHFACHTVAVALIAFQSEKGQLPEELDALVPDYLSAIPADPYDGAALRYSKERRVVYSVGTNLTDNGGVGTGSTEPRVVIDEVSR